MKKAAQCLKGRGWNLQNVDHGMCKSKYKKYVQGAMCKDKNPRSHKVHLIALLFTDYSSVYFCLVLASVLKEI